MSTHRNSDNEIGLQSHYPAANIPIILQRQFNDRHIPTNDVNIYTAANNNAEHYPTLSQVLQKIDARPGLQAISYHTGNLHHVGFIIDNRDANQPKVYYMNSLGSPINILKPGVDELEAWLKSKYKDKYIDLRNYLDDAQTTIQTNGHDCGPYTINWLVNGMTALTQSNQKHASSNWCEALSEYNMALTRVSHAIDLRQGGDLGYHSNMTVFQKLDTVITRDLAEAIEKPTTTKEVAGRSSPRQTAKQFYIPASKADLLIGHLIDSEVDARVIENIIEQITGTDKIGPKSVEAVAVDLLKSTDKLEASCRQNIASIFGLKASDDKNTASKTVSPH